METLTVKEAYLAMYAFLNELWKRTGSDDLAGFLGGMSFLESGHTADAAAWDDWLDAVKSARAGEVDAMLRIIAPPGK